MMKWLFIIDTIASMKFDTDTTYPIIKEAFGRGKETYIAEIKDLFFDKKARVNAEKIIFENNRHRLEPKKSFLLDDFDLILMRKEPPYNMAYHYSTILLSLTKKNVVNSPVALRDFNEKLITLNFPGLIPKTLISNIKSEILEFVEKNDTIVVKALDSYQGKIVKKINKNDKDAEKVINDFTNNESMPILAQEFLPNIIKGDKRILVLGGKILGAVNRIPKHGSFLSNFGQGGKGEKTKITEKEKQIVKKLAPFFKKHGIHFAGLDIIDGYLTEINITCPTGLQHINKLENKKLEKDVVDYLEGLNK
jgi:glutathione synthase